MASEPKFPHRWQSPWMLSDGQWFRFRRRTVPAGVYRDRKWDVDIHQFGPELVEGPVVG